MAWFSFGSKSSGTTSTSRTANKAMDAQRTRERQQEASRVSRQATLEKQERKVLRAFDAKMKKKFGNQWS